MTIAFPFVPGPGGHAVIFRNLSAELAKHGSRIVWIASGRNARLMDPRYLPGSPERSGFVLCPDTDDPLTRASAILSLLERERIDVLFFNILGDVTDHNLAFYLPLRVRRIAVVHSITPMTYRAARALRDHMDAVVGVSPRIVKDLVRHHGFDPGKTLCIPNTVDLEAFPEPPRRPLDQTVIRILSLGRIEEFSKGVLWLPDILHRVRSSGVNAQLTVAGDGPDLGGLKKRMTRLGLDPVVRFLGRVPPESVPHLASDHDVFIMPSRFEGIGLALLECMAAGCVPVTSRISGVTDYVIRHGSSGFTFPVGSTEAAAACITRLARDPATLSQMSLSARRTIEESFSAPQQTAAYLGLIQRVVHAPSQAPAPLPLSSWRIAKGLRPGWWHPLPEPIKARLRVLRERLHG